MPTLPGEATGTTPPSKPGPGNWAINRNRLCILTSGQPHRYATRAKSRTYRSVIFDPATGPGTTPASLTASLTDMPLPTVDSHHTYRQPVIQPATPLRDCPGSSARDDGINPRRGERTEA